MKQATLLTLLLVSLQVSAGDIDQPHTRSSPALSASLRATDSKPKTAWSKLDAKKLRLRSASALVIDTAGNEIYSKQPGQARPIGSITKLMTVMVTLDAKLPLNEKIPITKQDRDLIRLTGSRLNYGATLSRGDLLNLALMASENRAASALARTYPGGTKQCIKAMNAKAHALKMTHSHFADPTGLVAENVATPHDLAKMVLAAADYPEIQQATTRRRMEVHPYPKRGALIFGNTNRLLKNGNWHISLSKTGYINEAGRCLVMQAKLRGKRLIIVLLDSFGKLTPFGDANRIRKWIEHGFNS